MKKLLLLSLLIPALSFSYNHNAALNAIIESDYNAFISACGNEPLPATICADFLNINDQVITLRQKWVVEHAKLPQVGKDLIAASMCLIGSSIGFSISAECIKSLNNGSKNPEGNVFGLFIGLGIASVSGYFAITKFINAFQMPKKLFANALRIKDALQTLC